MIRDNACVCLLVNKATAEINLLTASPRTISSLFRLNREAVNNAECFLNQKLQQCLDVCIQYNVQNQGDER